MESMDRSTLAQQVESVERNVAFLQQEHRILLSGLRLEICNLKKRCSELSCELSERPPVRSREDIDLEEELRQARLLETEQHLAEQESALVELRKKGALASALQVRLRDEERRFLEELKRRSHKITSLTFDCITRQKNMRKRMKKKRMNEAPCRYQNGLQILRGHLQ